MSNHDQYLELYDYGSNLFLRFNLDPLFSLLGAALPENVQSIIYVLFSLLCWIGGLALLIREERQDGWLSTALIALLAGCLLKPALLFSNLHWFPALVWALSARRVSSISQSAVRLIVAGLWGYTGGALAGLGGLFALFAVIVRNRAFDRLSVWCLCVVGISGTLFFPEARSFGYPSSALLHPLSERALSGALGVGPGTLQSLPDFRTIGELLAVDVMLLGLVAVLFAVIHPVSDRSQTRRVLSASLLLSLFLLPEIFLAESSAVTPFCSLLGAVYGARSIPDPTFILALFAPCAVLTFVLGSSQHIRVMYSGALCLLFALRLFGNFGLAEDRFRSWLGNGEHEIAVDESPSRFVDAYARSANLWPADSRPENALSVNLFRLSSKIQPEQLSKMVDGDPATRWSTAHPQRPGDSFEILLGNANTISSIHLTLRKHLTDFPRGVELALFGPDGREVDRLRVDRWLGPVEYSTLGFPFLGAQSSVELRLRTPRPVQRIQITQIGSDPTFDWSVDELEIRIPALEGLGPQETAIVSDLSSAPDGLSR